MWEGSYGKEPFDLRLTVLRFLRNLNIIAALTLAGTLIFGGGYYVKNVLLRPEMEYSATSTYKVEYVIPPVESGDYYINEMTWNTLVQSEEFLSAVQAHLSADTSDPAIASGEIGMEELAAAISARLPSDWNIPTTTVVTNDPEKSVRIARVVEMAMAGEFVEDMEEVEAVRVIDPATVAEEVEPDVRPVRAFVLSAILSFFFVTVIFLLKETGDDSIRLPATLHRRYGLKVLGTINSRELKENVNYLFRGRGKRAVCSVDGDVDIAEVVKTLQEKTEEPVSVQWIAAPAVLLCPESCETLREMDGLLLVVRAGSHAGKPLEYAMEYLTQQDCEITAALLWDADERLINAYYCFSKDKREQSIGLDG